MAPTASSKSKRRGRALRRVAAGRPLKAAAIVAGGLLGTFVAIKAFGGRRAGPAVATAGPLPAKAPALQVGVQSAQVKTLQQALVQLGGEPARQIQAGGGADGKFGPATQRALAAAGLPNPAQLTDAAYRGVLQRATALVKAKKNPAAAPQAAPKALAPPAAPKKAAAAPRPAGNNLPAAGLPLTQANVTQLRGSLIHAVLAGDLAKIVAVLKYLRVGADWDQVAHTRGYQPWQDAKGRSLDANIVANFGATNPYLVQQFARLGLSFDPGRQVYRPL